MGSMKSKEFTNTNLKPTEITKSAWLWCEDDEIYKKYHAQMEKACGKWMMFFPKDVLDEKWATACQLYHDEKLTGIAGMKVSTACRNDRASDQTTGVIIFYCGPANEENTVMEYGRNLLEQLPYKSDNGYMYYKSDQQTSQGTRATGRKKNSLYRLKTSGDTDPGPSNKESPRATKRKSSGDEEKSSCKKRRISVEDESRNEG